MFPAESVLEFNVSHSDIKIDVLGSLLDENFQILTPLNYVSPDLLFGLKFYIQAVQPSTGDVIYDDFQDGPSYMELEAHLEHICPEELLLPESLTIKTENFIKDFVTRVQRFVINSLHLEGNLKTKKNTPHLRVRGEYTT